MAMYSIKMRASQKNEGVERHISGAEKIIKDENLEKCLNQLLQRALNHGKGSPDFINMKIEKVDVFVNRIFSQMLIEISVSVKLI